MLVIDEPVAVENFLANAFQTLAERFAETDAADDLGLRVDELYLSADELRAEIDAIQRVEMRALGQTAARIDQELALDAEQPKISVGKERAKETAVVSVSGSAGTTADPTEDRLEGTIRDAVSRSAARSCARRDRAPPAIGRQPRCL